MKRELTKTNDKGDWCTIRVELRPAGSPPNHHKEAELAVTAAYGVIIAEAEAEEKAIQYWQSFFEDSKAELGRMAIEYGTRTPRAAAEKVVEIDGEHHGLDVEKVEDGKVFIGEGGGCSHDVLAEWFPEAAHWFRWHLNCMKAACEHQEEMGWKTCPGFHKPGTSCPAPKMPLPMARIWTCDRAWDEGCKIPEDYAKRAEKLMGKRYPTNRFYSGGSFMGWPKELPARGKKCQQGTWIAVDGAENSCLCPKCGQLGSKATAAMPWALAYSAGRYGRDCYCEHDALCAPCPTCGYRYGSAWLERKLPDDVLQQVTHFIETGELPKEAA